MSDAEVYGAIDNYAVYIRQSQLAICQTKRRRVRHEIRRTIYLIRTRKFDKHRVRSMTMELEVLLIKNGSLDQRIAELGGPDYSAKMKRLVAMHMEVMDIEQEMWRDEPVTMKSFLEMEF